PPERITNSPSENSRPSPDSPKTVTTKSNLSKFSRVVIAPISRGTSETEYTLEKVDEAGAVVRLSNGMLIRIPKADYLEGWDDAKEKPKLILTRKYFQGYYPGHESAE